jgi:aminocarboxymuconate-semialdehyde decarboxylase
MNRWLSQCSCIDVHTHVVPEQFPSYTGRSLNLPWPSTVAAQACHRHVMISGKIYRTVSHHSWNTDERIIDMDRQAISRQVLSPMPELLSYWLPAEDGALLARFMNDCIAEMIARAPSRFSGLGTVPLQDVDRAIRELEYLCNELHLSGVEIGSNIDGVVIGDPKFLPFFEAASRLNAAVFVHALKPAGMDRLVGPAQLEQLLAFPGEVGLAAASLLTGGTLNAVPGLRIAFSHGGGSLPTLIPRLEHGWNSVPAVRQTSPQPPSVLARKMFYDDLVYDSAALHNLIRVYGASQLMIGSDYPFVIMDHDPIGSLDKLGLDEASARLLAEGNARRWLALPN